MKLIHAGLVKVYVLILVTHCNIALAQEKSDLRKLRLAAPPTSFNTLKDLMPFEYENKDRPQDDPAGLRIENCLALDDLANVSISRSALDLLIHCEAIRRYDIADMIEFVRSPNNARAIKQVAMGQADALAVTNFLTTYARLEADNVLITDSVIRLGETELGVFTAPNREDILNIKNPEAFRSLTGITVSHWDMDVMTMKTLTENVMMVADHLLIPGILRAKRADFTLQELSKKHIRGNDGKTEYARIDGYKVVLPDARAYIVHPSQQKYFEAMQDFIRKNREAGKNDLIMKAYSDIGWISLKYKNWFLLNEH